MNSKPTEEKDGKKRRSIIELPVESVLKAFYENKKKHILKFNIQDEVIELDEIVQLEVGQVRAVCRSKNGKFMVELNSCPEDSLHMECRIVNLTC